MAFLKLFNAARYQDNKDGPKIAKVINNNDPKKQGRIKVSLDGMFEPKDSEGSNLPWIRRQNDTFLNGRNSQAFSVPKVGDVVEIIWPYGKSHAFYRGVPCGSYNNTGTFTENYPYQSGLCVGDLQITFDEPTHSIKISNNDGFSITADAMGDVTIQGGNINIESDMDIYMKAPTVNIDGNLTVTGQMDVNTAASGVIVGFGTVATVSNGIVSSIT